MRREHVQVQVAEKIAERRLVSRPVNIAMSRTTARSD